MLGAIGFIVLAVIVGAYAYTSFKSYALAPQRAKRSFVAAYSILSVTALVWLMTFFSPDDSVKGLVFMTDVMLVVASICILGVILDITKPLFLTLATLVGAALLTLRAFAIPPAAYTADGLLHFNLSQVEVLFIGGIFLIVWLPATIKMVYLAFRSERLLPFRSQLSFIFISTVLMTSYFLSARRPIMIIFSFVPIIIFFAILTGINIFLYRSMKSVKQRKGLHG